MKKSLWAIFCLISWNAFANSEKIVKSTVKKVTVYTQGAQVFRSANVSISTGVTDFVFSNVSPKINASSIQAGGKGNFIILDVKHQFKYPEPPKTDNELPKEVVLEIALLQDSLTELQFMRDEIADRKSALELEKDMILKNKLAKSEGKSDSLPVLKQAMEFFRAKLNDLNTQLSTVKRRELFYASLYNRTNERLQKLKTYKNSEAPPKNYEPIHSIVVSVSANEPVTGTVEVSYMVSQAGWVPSYDLRAVTASAPMQLTYKANVFQNTGEDWDNVKIKLSTSNPSRSNVKPVLPPWYINYFTGIRESKIPSMARSQSGANVTTLSEEDDKKLMSKVKDLPNAETAANYSMLIETMTHVEFDIQLSYSIPPDNAMHVVSVKTSELPASYRHHLVPKLESEAFLLARVTGWEELNLLPGSANIFYEGTYVGQTVLNPSVINDTLELALGRDNGIVVTRTRLPLKETHKLLGSEITKTIAYELRMKNNKSKSVNLVVEDQVPLSQNKEIRVEVIDHGKADYNMQTGLLKWEMTIDSKAYKSLKFTYQVTSNKDLVVNM
jgi:uncharacterized protein (TIGR02231 family)